MRGFEDALEILLKIEGGYSDLAADPGGRTNLGVTQPALDEAIERGCLLAKSGAVVVKVSKPNQDKRFDIPTIGENTIETIAKYNGSILAFEANETIVVNKEKLVELANKYNICLLSV